jgi:UDP-glucose 4-epimerase
VVYAASSSAYGDQPTLPKAEQMLPDPLSPYAVAKLVGEYYCQVFTRVYGLRQFRCATSMFLDHDRIRARSIRESSRDSSATLLSNERPVIYGDGEQSRDFTYIDNVVAANLKAASRQTRQAKSSTSRTVSELR